MILRVEHIINVGSRFVSYLFPSMAGLLPSTSMSTLLLREIEPSSAMLVHYGLAMSHDKEMNCATTYGNW